MDTGPRIYDDGQSLPNDQHEATPDSSTDGTALATAVAGVGGVGGTPGGENNRELVWEVEDGPAANYTRLGERLAAHGDLFRNRSDGHGLIQVLATGETRLIEKGARLAPAIVDRLKMTVKKGGKVLSDLPTTAHLNAMLHSEMFLRMFLAVDEVARLPYYLPDFNLAPSGYYNGGPGHRILYVGPEPHTSDSMETIRVFLDAMNFATQADRTNSVAAALTVLLRNHWFGAKPLILLTGTVSHAGKGTIEDFIRGAVPKADILYECIDWPMQASFQRQIIKDPDIGFLSFDNVRKDSAGGRAGVIRSAFIESFVTSCDYTLASPAAGNAIRLKNNLVTEMNTNEGTVSTDVLNRSLPIHLAPKGDVHARQSPIGNPKHEFLPQNREQIEAELRGIIERWRQAGCPLDEKVKHSMTPWAQTVGGILRINGFEDFLANYATQRTAADPVRNALGILGAAKPGEALKPTEWADITVTQGLSKTLFSSAERDTLVGRQRAIGCMLKRHLEQTFEVETDTHWYRLQLTGGNRRWKRGENAHVRYRFDVLEERPLPADENEEQFGDAPSADSAD